MFAIAIYVVVAALAALSAQAFRPSAALINDYHRRIYWTGAAAVVVLVGIGSSALIV